MDSYLRALIIEDSADDTESILQMLRKNGNNPVCERVDSEEKMVAVLGNQSWDVIIANSKNKDLTISSALNLIEKHAPDLSVVVISGESSIHRDKEDTIPSSERHFRLLADTSREAIALFDEKDVLLQANSQYFKTFGYAEEEALGEHTILTIIAPNSTEIVRQKAASNIRGQFESIGIRKDGTQFPIELRLKIIKYNGHTVRSAAIRDITERKMAKREKANLEKQLQQAQKMEAIGTLAGGIAHDFNNILAAIMGFVEMAQLDTDIENPIYPRLAQVLKATHRAKDLVKQILTFSRETEYDKKPVNISLIIKEVLKLLRASLPSTIEIRQDIAANSGTVLASPTQIHQILMNLCTNAYHAMVDNGGILAISLKSVDLDKDNASSYPGLKPGPYLKLTVSDTGHGMEPETLSRIFDPYFSTKEKDLGTGMGLSVVHGIVRNHCGLIIVNSEPDQGAKFDIFFPRINGETKPDIIVRAPFPIGNEQILFVDDEEILVDLGKQMLNRLGYKVVCRTSSVEALEAFRAAPDKFDLVISDLTMPNMTGNTLAKEMIKIRSDIPVILCTGFGDPLFEDKARTEGIKEILMKPMTLSAISETIRKVLDNKSDNKLDKNNEENI